MELTQEYIKSILHYEPDTGLFRWKKAQGSRRRNQIAGSVGKDGYIIIPIFHYFAGMKKSKPHRAHRLAILYANGEMPDCVEVDHINGVTSDNRLGNLRVCFRSGNAKNIRKTRGTSRFKGVHADKGGFRAAICVDGKRYRFGPFKDEIEAAKAYDQAAKKLHGRFACTNDDLGFL